MSKCPEQKGSEIDVPLCPNVSVPTGSPDCRHLSSLPVISRTFKRNFNYKQFSPTSEPNLQVCRNFTRWVHGGSTENSGPAGSGLRSREWVCSRRAYSRCRARNRRKTGCHVPGCSPSSDKATPRVPWYVFNNHHTSPLPLVGLSVSCLQRQES